MSSTIKRVSFADRPQTAASTEKKHKKLSSGTITHVQANLLKHAIPVPPEKGSSLPPSKITTPPPTPRPLTPVTVPKEDS